MTIYDRKISVHDNLDCLEDRSLTEEVSPNDLATAKEEISRIDDVLGEEIDDLETLQYKFKYHELKLTDIQEFLETELPIAIENLKKIRRELY